MKNHFQYFVLLTNLILCSISAIGVTYVESDAQILVDFSAAAYCSGTLGNGVENWDCNVCKKYPNVTAVPVFNTATNANGFVGYDPFSKTIIVSFSGTDPLSLRNWIDDIDAIKVTYNNVDCGCQVHQGFYDTYLSVQDQVLNFLTTYTLAYPNAAINVTGHSLGAALAVHAALDITLTLGLDVNTVYTFGQPRVGDDSFQEFYTSQVSRNFRLTHYKDPVPHLPAENFGFHHNPVEVFYDEFSGDYKICNYSGEDPHCSDKYLADLNVEDNLFYVGMDFESNYLSCKL